MKKRKNYSNKKIGYESPIQSLELTKKISKRRLRLILLKKKFTGCRVHYINGSSVKCEYPCKLCKAGIKNDLRFLIPVYNFNTGQSEVLSVSKSRDRQGALLPQLVEVMNKPKKKLIFISKTNDFDFEVSTNNPTRKEKIIFIKEKKKMRIQLKTGKIDLQNIYQKISENELKEYLKQKKDYESVGIITGW